MSSTIKLLPLTFLIASKPAPVNGAAISSGPPREPGGGKSSAASKYKIVLLRVY
jgi:hypothetical protein